MRIKVVIGKIMKSKSISKRKKEKEKTNDNNYVNNEYNIKAFLIDL